MRAKADNRLVSVIAVATIITPAAAAAIACAAMPRLARRPGIALTLRT